MRSDYQEEKTIHGNEASSGFEELAITAIKELSLSPSELRSEGEITEGRLRTRSAGRGRAAGVGRRGGSLGRPLLSCVEGLEFAANQTLRGKMFISEPINARLLDLGRRLADEGADDESVLVSLRKADADIVGSIRVLKAIRGYSMAEAQECVHSSEAWSDRREEIEALQERLEEALRGADFVEYEDGDFVIDLKKLDD